jgi:hypothetical protein
MAELRLAEIRAVAESTAARVRAGSAAGIGVSEMTRLSGLARSTVYRHLGKSADGRALPAEKEKESDG